MYNLSMNRIYDNYIFDYNKDKMREAESTKGKLVNIAIEFGE